MRVRNMAIGGQVASQRTDAQCGRAASVRRRAEMMLRIMCGGHRRYLEFGVGGSTLMATRSGLQSVVAVDLDPHWVDAVTKHPEIDAAIRGGRADIRHADIGPVTQWGYPRDLGHIQCWPTYIATAWDAWSERNEMPDLIFVDGRFRVACCLSVVLVAASGSHPTDDLRVLLHDVGPDRPYYDEVFAILRRRRIGEHASGNEDQIRNCWQWCDVDAAEASI